jgi:hypothetical protein
MAKVTQHAVQLTNQFGRCQYMALCDGSDALNTVAIATLLEPAKSESRAPQTGVDVQCTTVHIRGSMRSLSFADAVNTLNQADQLICAAQKLVRL